MTAFQIIALGLLIPSIAWSLRTAIRHGKRRHLLSSLVLAFGITFVVRPDVATRTANFLGIGRGADLISYLSALAVLGCYYMVLNLDRNIRIQITELNRAIALLQSPDAVHSQQRLEIKRPDTQADDPS